MEKGYYAVIPASVRYDEMLKDKAKLLYGEITALTNAQGFCWASNSYFAELYNVTKETISRLLKNLSDRGYITIKLVYKNKEIVGRKIYIQTSIGIDEKINTYCQNSQEGIDQNINTPIDEKVKENNTILNNTINNTLDNNTISKDIVCSTKVQPVIDAWNSLGLQEVKAINQGTNRYKLFNARVKQYGLDNILKAVENIAGSKFLKGQNRTGWIITFDWLIKPNNFIKVLEGNYNDNIINLNEHVNSVKNQNEKQKLRFNNFESRDYYNNPKEMDQLEKKLLGWDDEN